MSRIHAILSVFMLVLLATPLAHAADHESPVGTWRSIDDATGKAKAIIEITERNGVLEGHVREVLQSDQGPHPICSKCEGERKDQPVEGMLIVWDMTRAKDAWSGGHILDPKNGKTYRCKMTLDDNGMTLKVRGFLGVAMLGRTQTWQRAD